MNDPLGLLPFALASGGGTINGMPAEQAVAAGVTLLQRCAPLVRALAGRRAAILMPGGPAFLTALAATEGRAAVLINALASPPEIAHQIADADVGAVFTLSALAAGIPAHVLRVELDDLPRSARVTADGQTREVDLGSHFAIRLEGEIGAEGRDEEAAIVYTSAMEGTSLGAILTHRNLLGNARAAVKLAHLTSDDRMLAPLPWSHLFGLMATGAAPLLAGAAVMAPDRFSPSLTLESLEKDGVTILAGVPRVFRSLLAALEKRQTPLRAPALRLCICGGAPMEEELQTRWYEAVGVELRQGYGLTEAGPMSLFNSPEYPNHRGTLGLPFPGVEVTIRDVDTGLPCPDGVEGEICIRGDNVSPGYVGGAVGLERRDGWLRSGDRGVRTSDGYFTFRGFIKRMFTRDGYNVYPAELERVLRQLHGVKNVRVSGVRSDKRENDIRVEVTGGVTEEDIRGWCASQLAAYKQPSEVVVSGA